MGTVIRAVISETLQLELNRMNPLITLQRIESLLDGFRFDRLHDTISVVIDYRLSRSCGNLGLDGKKSWMRNRPNLP